MPAVVSLGTCELPHIISQRKAMDFVKTIFEENVSDVNRLLKIFDNGQIEQRNFVVSFDWLQEDHTFSEKNELYIKKAVEFGKIAIEKCLHNKKYLNDDVSCEEIHAIIFVSSTGISTPTIDARIMNELPFLAHVKRIPLWGLGCAGGASALSRAYDYCLAYPNENVLIVSVELCSLTFQKTDLRKSNIIGTSLFSDGVASVLVCGKASKIRGKAKKNPQLTILGTESVLLKDSQDVMGWDLNENGLQVIFSKDIPTLIKKWLKPNVDHFLKRFSLDTSEIASIIAHPGGKKVLDTYEEALNISKEKTAISRDVLKNYGNMSSATIFYVMDEHLSKARKQNDYAFAMALGPGFSAEFLLLQWE